MLNYMRADCYRVFSKKSAWIWTLILLVVPPLMIVGASSQYETEMIISVIPTVIYFLFFVVSLSLTENIFGEDKRLGLFKNDTTSGISRTELFVSKFLTGAFAEIGLWAVCSIACAVALAYISGFEYVGSCFLQLFSIQSIWWLLLNIFYLIFFQAIRTLVNKTSVLILVCSVINTVFSQMVDLVKKAFPIFGSFMNMANIATMEILPIVTMFSVLLIGIIAMLIVGCYLFRRSEF